MEFFPLYDGPAMDLCSGNSFIDIPRPLDRRHAIKCRQLAVKRAVDVSEVKLAPTLHNELDVAFFFLIDEILLPGDRDDPPAASEGIWRLGT